MTSPRDRKPFHDLLPLAMVLKVNNYRKSQQQDTPAEVWPRPPVQQDLV